MSKLGIVLDVIPLTLMLLLWLSGHLNLIRAAGCVIAIFAVGFFLTGASIPMAWDVDHPGRAVETGLFGFGLMFLGPWLGLLIGYVASTPAPVSPAKKAHRAYEALPPGQKKKLHRGVLNGAKLMGPHVAAWLRKKNHPIFASLVEDGSKML